VVTAVVFDPEVSVHRHRQYDFRQRALKPGFLVAKFMAGVDAQSTGDSGYCCETEKRPPA